MWARVVSLITGIWRLETVAINGPVQTAGAPVRPGDIVVADENGVCFIPHEPAAELLKRAREPSQGEDLRAQDVSASLSVFEVANKPYFRKHPKR